MWKFLKVPSAKEMGRSEHVALASRAWGTKPGEYTWEDWEEEARVVYPFRWWLRQTGLRIVGLAARIGFKRDAIVSRFIHRHHILDLRKCGDSEYSGGYIDPSDAMVLAIFGILKSYVEECEIEKYVENLKEHIETPLENPTENDLEVRESLRLAYLTKKEVVDIYRWWMVEKPNAERELASILSNPDDGKVSKNERERRSVAYNRKSEELEERLEEMLLRVISVRGSLWE